MADNRRHRRFIVDDMGINGKMVFASEVRVINISIAGISITADRRLDIGSEYALKINDKNRSLNLRGVVVWSSISGSREGLNGQRIPVYAAGLKFADILNDRADDLMHFVELHKMDGDHRVTGLRFRIDSSEKALVNFPSDYKVKRLSLGGMLISSSEALNIDEVFPMEISLPDARPVHFLGRVSSCHQIESKGPVTFHIGISFIGMQEKDRERLWEFVGMLRDINKKTA